MFYRKYRPQTVGELDNTRIKETLGKALLDNNFVHAYLLVGPKGTGKTTTGRIIAKIVNCPERKKGQEPCNRCASCQAITQGRSLDVVEIDAASNTGVDDVRDLREKIKFAPTVGPYKVYIIDEAHMLSTSAFNALLKTLEEPPPHAIFVLATTQSAKVPATIVSRCLVYNFGLVPKSDLVSSLKKVTVGEDLKVEETALSLIVEKADGSFRDAQKLLEQLAMHSKKIDEELLTKQLPSVPLALTQEILAALSQKNKKDALEKIARFGKLGGNFRDLIASLIGQLRDLLLVKSGVSDESVTLKIDLTEEECLSLVAKFTAANAQLTSCPIAQLPLEVAVIEFCGLEKSENSQNPKIRKSGVPVSGPTQFSLYWQEVLKKIKEQNHNLVALLRASQPGKIEDGLLTLEVFYKFHKEKLEEKKNRDILEKVISDIMGRKIKIKFELTSKVQIPARGEFLSRDKS